MRERYGPVLRSSAFFERAVTDTDPDIVESTSGTPRSGSRTAPGPTSAWGHFSVVQVKVVLHALLSRYRIEVPPGCAPKRQLVSFPKPGDDLPVRLVPLRREGGVAAP